MSIYTEYNGEETGEEEVIEADRNEPVNNGNPFNRILSSTLSLICAFIVSNSLLQVMIGTVATSFGYSVITSYNLIITAPNDYHFWSFPRTVAIFFIPPALCVGMAAFIFILLLGNKKWINRYRLFLFWMMVCLVNMVLANLVFAPLGVDQTGSTFFKTFAVVATWIHLSPEILMFFSLISIILSLMFGLIVNTELLRFSNSKKMLKTAGNRNRIVFQLFLVPFFLASVPLILLSTHKNLLPTMVVLLNLPVICLGLFLMNVSRRARLKVSRADVLSGIPILEIAACGGLWFWVYLFFK